LPAGLPLYSATDELIGFFPEEALALLIHDRRATVVRGRKKETRRVYMLAAAPPDEPVAIGLPIAQCNFTVFLERLDNDTRLWQHRRIGRDFLAVMRAEFSYLKRIDQ
jgi:hypothetical protein